MKIIFELFLISLLPIVVSIGLMVLLNKWEKLNNLTYWKKQILYGVIFGICSILGTVMGVSTDAGAIINVRDVGPMCAGFIYGGPAGIIAGFIGGIFRFIAPYIIINGIPIAGSYTALACTISTIFAGIVTAIIRKFVFNGKHGKWYYGFSLGTLVESFHMLTVFFTHMDDVETVYGVVANCAAPMIIVNSLAVMISMIGVSIVNKRPLLEKQRPLKISTIIQIGLLLSIALAYISISFFSLGTIMNVRNKSTDELLESNIVDIQKDVDDEINRELIEVLNEIKASLDTAISNSLNIDEEIEKLSSNFAISYISLVNKNNEILNSYTTVTDDFQINEYVSLGIFDSYFIENDYFVKDYQLYNPDTFTHSRAKYCGVLLKDNSFNYRYIVICYNNDYYHDFINKSVTYTAINRHVGNEGFVVVTDSSGNVLSKTNELNINNVFDLSLIKTKSKVVNSFIYKNIEQEFYLYSIYEEGYYIIAAANKDEVDLDSNISIMSTTLTELFIFLVMFCVIYSLIKRFVVDSIEKVNNSLNLISDGDLNIVVSERNSHEMNSLSDDINKTVDTLKGFIERESKKIDEELAFAKNIQSSSLPQTFPPFPNIKSFDIYALMKTAKEVGGDFYDFYLLGENKVCLLIADVSGKGIPAAMFMMKSKSIIKGLVEQGLPLDEAITIANKRICEGNDAQMFVTAWICILNYETGHVEYVNAGHNPPVLKHNNKYEYLKSKPGFILGGLDFTIYHKQEFYLDEGDMLYLYTDGVTEATNVDKKLFGEDRLLELLNNINESDPEETCKKVINELETFTIGEPQSDDITMLNILFKNKK